MWFVGAGLELHNIGHVELLCRSNDRSITGPWWVGSAGSACSGAAPYGRRGLAGGAAGGTPPLRPFRPGRAPVSLRSLPHDAERTSQRARQRPPR